MQKFVCIFVFLFFFSSCSFEENQNDNTRSLSQNLEKSYEIIALGDSLTAGYGLDIQDSYPSQLEGVLKNSGYNYTVINAGVSGNTSQDLLSRLDWTLEGISPEIALLVIGGNDGLRGGDIETMKKNIIQIIDILQSKNIQVVLGGMQIPPNIGFQYASEFKQVFREISKEKNVYFIDFFLDGVATKKEFNLPDMIHPNKEGYRIVSNNVFQFLVSNKLLLGSQ